MDFNAIVFNWFNLITAVNRHILTLILPHKPPLLSHHSVHSSTIDTTFSQYAQSYHINHFFRGSYDVVLILILSFNRIAEWKLDEIR